MPQSLAGQVILITGASAGIGAALAKALAPSSNVRLVLAARRVEKLEEVAIACRSMGAEVLTVATDMAEPAQVEALAQAALEKFGRVDAVVNNAGYGQMGPIELVPTEAAQQQFAVNLIAPLTLVKMLIPPMRSQGGGRIVNISSLGGRLAFPLGGLYSSSKFALEGLSDALRMELEPFNIKVSVVEPGPVGTEFFDVSKQTVATAIANPTNTPYRAAFEQLDQLRGRLGRQLWTSEQVAQVIIKALSDRHPRPRYVAATGGNILLFLMTKVMPTWMVDDFWQRFYGIDRVAKDWQSNQAD
ncbi:MAG: SDR family oxidoreductase [Leptolyngbyaceae cyanobacterium SL_7_1]|nr:SDR family oxidoreductase [Leptolyngbyaceae cyanobacterium SL_7_1]